MTSTRPVKALAACLIAAGSVAIAAPAFAGTSTPPSVPGSSVPGGGANATIDVGAAAPTPELIADFQATGFDDPAAIFAQYGFGDVPGFPIVTNAVLYQVMGRGEFVPGDESGSHSLSAYFVVTATDAELQGIVDAVAAGVVPDASLYELSAGNGTDDTSSTSRPTSTPSSTARCRAGRSSPSPTPPIPARR